MSRLYFRDIGHLIVLRVSAKTIISVKYTLFLKAFWKSLARLILLSFRWTYALPPWQNKYGRFISRRTLQESDLHPDTQNMNPGTPTVVSVFLFALEFSVEVPGLLFAFPQYEIFHLLPCAFLSFCGFFAPVVFLSFIINFFLTLFLFGVPV